MRASKYNFFSYTSNGERIIFNALSSALAKIDDKHYKEYKLIEAGEEDKSLLSPEEIKEIHEPLLKGRFIYPDDALDEKEFIGYSYNKSKYSDIQFNLTIAPTTACNFDCYYCYEKWMKIKRNSYLTEKIEKEILKFVEFNLNNKKYLSVSWYGGEPLLAVDNIYRMSKSLIDLCKDKDCNYSSSIVTNGYLFNKDVVDRLAELKVRSAQITIDGPKEIHDRRRFDKKKGPSFDIIMKNIEYAKKFMNIDIRINIDRENSEELEPFLDYLKDKIHTGNVGVYLGRVSDCNQDLNKEYANLLLESKEYFIKRKEILNKAIIKKKINWIGEYPSPKIIPCGAVNINTFAIDPEGYVYKCWEVIGDKEEALFNVSNPEFINEKQLNWINWDPKNDEECNDCKFLPICNGGCVLSSMKGKKECTYWKTNLKDMLGVLAYKYEHLMSNKSE